MSPKSINQTSMIFFILLLVIIGQMSIDIYLPSLPAMTDYFHTNNHAIQLTLSTFLLGFGTSQLIYGPLSDHFGRRPLLITGMVIYVIATVLCLFAPTVSFLIVDRFIQGLGVGAASVSSRAILRDGFEGNKLLEVASYATIAWSLVPILAPVLGGYIQFYANWQMNFAIIALLGLLLTIALIKWLPETNKTIKNNTLTITDITSSYWSLLTSPIFMGNAGCIMILFGIFIAFNATGPFLLQTRLGLTPVQYSWALLLVSGGYLLGSFLNSRLTRRCSRRQAILLGFGLLLLNSSMMVFLALKGFFNVAVIVLPMFLIFLSMGFIYANCIAGSLRPFPHIAGIASALYGFLGFSGGSLTGIIVAHFPVVTQKPLALMILLQALASILVYFLTVWRVRENERAAA